MAVTTTARPSYNRRLAPKAYDPGWLMQELGDIQRAFVPTGSRTVKADDRVSSTDSIIYADATHGAFTLTLPSPGQVHDLVVTVKKVDNVNPVTILGRIDGATSYVLTTQYAAATLASNGVQYFLLGVL